MAHERCFQNTNKWSRRCSPINLKGALVTANRSVDRKSERLTINGGLLSRIEELADVRRVWSPFTAIVAAWPVTQEFREPGLVLDFFVQNRER